MLFDRLSFSACSAACAMASSSALIMFSLKTRTARPISPSSFVLSVTGTSVSLLPAAKIVMLSVNCLSGVVIPLPIKIPMVKTAKVIITIIVSVKLWLLEMAEVPVRAA